MNEKGCVLPVMTSLPAVALNLVSPVRRCFVRHWYVFLPSSLFTFLICSSPDGKTTYFPSSLIRENTILDMLIFYGFLLTNEPTSLHNRVSFGRHAMAAGTTSRTNNLVHDMSEYFYYSKTNNHIQR